MNVKIKCNFDVKYATIQSSGLDIVSNENIILNSQTITKVGTSLFLEMPENLEAQIRSRSSLASKGIIIPNSPGTIDADYRGEIKVLLYNLNQEPYEIKIGDKIAQIIFSEICKPTFIKVEEFSKTERGDGGFGSTGR